MDTLYRKFVMDLQKPGVEILEQLTPKDAQLLHMAVLASEEAGEVLSHIKKAVFYRKPLDMEKIKDELGDLEFALTALRELLGVSWGEVVSGNMKKLSRRFPAGSFNDTDAQQRVDVQCNAPA